MASSDPRSIPVRPADVASQEFELVRRGYDPDEVRAFLRRVAEDLSRLQGELQWQRARTEHVERRAASAQEGAYARLSRDFIEMIRRADEAAARVRRESEARAAEEVAAAHREAGRIVAEARDEAERVLADAGRDAVATRAPTRSDVNPAPIDEPPSPPSNLEPPEPPLDPWGAGDLSLDPFGHDAVDLEAIWAAGTADRELDRELGDGGRLGSVQSEAAEPVGDLDVAFDVSLFDLFEDDDQG